MKTKFETNKEINAKEVIRKIIASENVNLSKESKEELLSLTETVSLKPETAKIINEFLPTISSLEDSENEAKKVFEEDTKIPEGMNKMFLLGEIEEDENGKVKLPTSISVRGSKTLRDVEKEDEESSHLSVDEIKEILISRFREEGEDISLVNKVLNFICEKTRRDRIEEILTYKTIKEEIERQKCLELLV